MSKKTKRHHHDKAYHQLFSHPELVRDLLIGFIPDDLLQGIDYSTLELVNGVFVTEDQQTRTNDVIWRVKLEKDWLYLYILIEFQSKIDVFMAVRIMVYLGLLYQNLIRQKLLLPGNRLPPVLPIVLYNGKRKWRAKTQIADLIAPISGLVADYIPQLKYLLIEESAFAQQDFSHVDNLMAAVIQAEYPKDNQSLQDLINNLSVSLKDHTELNRTFYHWIVSMLSRHKALPMVSINKEDFEGTKVALLTELKRWEKQFFKEGFEQGSEQGIEQATYKTELKILQKQLNQRFGELPAEIVVKITTASTQQLDQWLDKVILANNLDDVFCD